MTARATQEFPESRGSFRTASFLASVFGEGNGEDADQDRPIL